MGQTRREGAKQRLTHGSQAQKCLGGSCEAGKGGEGGVGVKEKPGFMT